MENHQKIMTQLLGEEGMLHRLLIEVIAFLIASRPINPAVLLLTCATLAVRSEWWP
jgi:uncharacterized membrane protein YraQ (UPF0718 family)